MLGGHPLRQFLPLRAGFSFGRSSPYSFCPPNASALGSSGARSWTVAQAPFRPRRSGGGNRDQRHPATPAGSVPFLGNEAGQCAGIVGDPPRHAQRPHAAPDAFPPGQPASQAADGQTHDVAPSATSRAVKPSDNSRSVPRRWELRNSTLAARSDGHPSLTPLSKPECPPHPRTLPGPVHGKSDDLRLREPRLLHHSSPCDGLWIRPGTFQVQGQCVVTIGASADGCRSADGRNWICLRLYRMIP